MIFWFIFPLLTIAYPARWKKDLERKKKEEEEMLAEMRRKDIADKHKPWEPPSLDEAKRVRDTLLFQGGVRHTLVAFELRT